MTVYLDRSRNRFRGMIMCHMISDDITELFRMARLIGMRSEWFQFQPTSFPHFDVSTTRRKIAVSNGAVEIDRRVTVGVMRAYRERLLLDPIEKRLHDRLLNQPSFSFLDRV